MRYNSLDLAIVSCLAIVSILLTAIGAGNALLRLLFSLPLVFGLPGYALMTAIFPRGIRDIVARSVLTIGFSLTIVITSGILLNVTVYGLNPLDWSLVLGFVTLAMAGVAYLRRQTPGIQALMPKSPPLDARAIVIVGGAVLIMAFAFVIARNSAFQQKSAFTQLWLLPSEDSASKITVGVRNEEAKNLEYWLEVKADGARIGYWTELMIQSGDTWEAEIDLPADLRKGAPIDANLYKMDEPVRVYRSAQLWYGTE